MKQRKNPKISIPDEFGNNPQLLSQLLAHIGDGLTLADSSGRIIAADQRFAESLGYEVCELVGKHRSEIISPLFHETDADQYRSITDGTNDSIRSFRLLFRKDGSGLHAAVELIGCNAAGNPGISVASVYRKQNMFYSEYLQSVHPALGFHLSSEPDPAILIAAEDGRILFGSASFARMAGCSEAALAEMKLTDIIDSDAAAQLVSVSTGVISFRSMELSLTVKSLPGGRHTLDAELFTDGSSKLCSGRLLVIVAGGPHSQTEPAAEFIPEQQIFSSSTFHISDPGLTAREREVLILLQKRLNTKEIAFELNLAEITVRKHLTGIYRKFKVSCREDLLLLLLGRQLI